VGSHLQQAPHSDTHRLTSPIPETTTATYKSVAHPDPEDAEQPG
jgi:hypothetical protein